MSDLHDVSEVLSRLDRCRRVLITGHRNPDGDCLGAAIGFAELAEKMGVETAIVFRDPLPAGLDELPGADKALVREALPEDFPAAYDLVATMECPGLDRTGFEGLHAVPILNIDHHRSNERFGEINFLDEDSPAAGEMVWRLFEAAPVEPSADTATALFAAVATDTGDFRYSNATGTAFRAAGEMVEWGADPTRVAELVHQRKTVAAVRLLAEALATLELKADGRLAVIEVGPAAFEHAGAESHETDGIIDTPRSIAGVDVVAFFKQTEPGIVRVSLRSKGSIDVRSVAVRFGGGGHTNAAGCTIEADLPEARRTLTPLLEQILETTR